ncbi:MAG: 3-methylcrotonyl-CoA carboxylase, partial [Porticoccaceae bacterium]|nr:3-methylcrotonyl-CoA carboxylase [Porticoccaceae bacterium]
VEWQLRVAAGETLPLQQDELRINGHAFEARIYAEDPDNDFLPVTGTLNYLQPPLESEHVRVDTGVLQGDEVSVFYDPMIAKLIVWDENRDRALNRLTAALAQYRISGMTTNTEFLYNLASCKPFRDAELDTGFIEKHSDTIFHVGENGSEQYLPLAGLHLVLKQEQQAKLRAQGSSDPYSPWNRVNAWRLNEAHRHVLEIDFNGQSQRVTVEERAGNRYLITAGEQSRLAAGELNGDELYADIDGFRQRVSATEHDGLYTLFTADQALHFSLRQPDLGDADGDAAGNAMTAPMNGTIVTLLAEVGTEVEADAPLLVMEAMKMEHTIRAPAAGKVAEFYYQPGDLVDGGSELVAFEVLN